MRIFILRAAATFVLGILGGILSFLPTLGPTALGGYGAVLGLFAWLPLFFAALCFGRRWGFALCLLELLIWVAAFLQTAVFETAEGPLSAGFRGILFQAIPLLSFLCLYILTPLSFVFFLMRARTMPREVTTLFGRLWTPLGQAIGIVIVTIVALGVLIALAISAYGGDPQELMRLFLEQVFQQALDLPPSTLGLIAEEASLFFPMMTGYIFLFFLLMNLRLAQLLANALGWSLRPKLYFLSLSLPLWYSYIFVITAPFAFFAASSFAFIAYNAAGFLLAGFCLVGLGRLFQWLYLRHFLYPIAAVLILFLFPLAAFFALVLYGAYVQWGLYDSFKPKGP